MGKVEFLKMHGSGNDFIIVNCICNGTPDNLSILASAMCNRRLGVGADGLIAILPSEVADCRMRIFNADGSEAQMCGNGIRCVGKAAYESGIVSFDELTVETLSGIKRLHLDIMSDNTVSYVSVDMGKPVTRPELIPAKVSTDNMVEHHIHTASQEVKVTGISMGNPHGVIFVDSVNETPVPTLGPELETHPIWPEKANIEFVEVLDRHNVAMRTWERGVGETYACGTGACAAAYASILTNRTEWPVTVGLTGGELIINMNPESGHIIMSGPASYVFSGSYDESAL